MNNPYLTNAIYNQPRGTGSAQGATPVNNIPPTGRDCQPESTPKDPYSLPTHLELLQANIWIAEPSGKRIRVRPVEKLRLPIGCYFPPSGPYYDQPHLTLHFGPDYFKASGTGAKCTCCWRAKHVDLKKAACKQNCDICGTQDHSGKQCLKLFNSHRWWTDRVGCRLDSKTPINPTPSQRAYLLVAGIIKDWKTFDEPITLNMDHPLVKAHYQGKTLPQYMEPPPTKEEETQTLGKRKCPFDSSSDDDVEDGEIVAEEEGRQVEALVQNAQNIEEEEEDSLFIPDYSSKESSRMAELEEKLAQAEEELRKAKAQNEEMLKELAQTKSTLKDKETLIGEMVTESIKTSVAWAKRARLGSDES